MSPTRISKPTRALAKALRRDQTKGEKTLWCALRDLKAEDVRVRRQAPIGAYVVDFVVFSKKIIIEIDGDVHASDKQMAHDKRRDTWLRTQGFEVVRYSSVDVSENLEGVVLDIGRRFGLD